MRRALLFLLALVALALVGGEARGAFTEFYVQTTGDNRNSGHTTSNTPIVSGTNGNWNGTTTYIFNGATDLSTVPNDGTAWGALFNDGATVTVYIARITNVNDATDTLTFSTTDIAGTPPTSSATARSCRVGGAWAGPATTVAFPLGFMAATARNSAGDPPIVNFLNGVNYTPTAAMTHANNGPIFWQGYRALLTSVAAEADDDIFTKTSHGFTTGDRVVFQTGTGFTGITAGRPYWVISLTANTFKLAETRAQATSDPATAINVTVDGSAGTFKATGMAKIHGDSASPSAPYTMLTISGTGNIWRDMWFDDNGGTTGGQSVGNNAMVDVTGTTNRFEWCRFTGAYRSGLRVAGGGSVVAFCEVHSNQRDDDSGSGQVTVTEESTFLASNFHGANTGTDSCGILLGSDSVEPVAVIGCKFTNQGGPGILTTGNHHSLVVSNSIFVDNQHGFQGSGAIATTSVLVFSNCIFQGNLTYGVTMNNAGHRSGPTLINCAFGGNGTAATNNVGASFIHGMITLTGNPFVDSANGNFALDSTAQEGAALRAAGIGVFLQDSAVESAATVGYPDVGAAQSAGSVEAAAAARSIQVPSLRGF
jgi:hypothetical protein